jgi:hypothetical protein
LTEFVRGLSSDALGGFKLGPDAYATCYRSDRGILCVAVVAWSTANSPSVLLMSIWIVLAFALYIIERLVRFAEKNPAAVLLGGTEFYHHLRDQIAAKDPKG